MVRGLCLPAVSCTDLRLLPGLGLLGQLNVLAEVVQKCLFLVNTPGHISAHFEKEDFSFLLLGQLGTGIEFDPHFLVEEHSLFAFLDHPLFFGIYLILQLHLGNIETANVLQGEGGVDQGGGQLLLPNVQLYLDTAQLPLLLQTEGGQVGDSLDRPLKRNLFILLPLPADPTAMRKLLPQGLPQLAV